MLERNPAMPRTIFITGCSSGIGRHCALTLQAQGWRVFATARKADDIDGLRQAGLEALFLDYGQPQSIADAFGQAMQATGGQLDALFHNGAYAQPGAVEDLPIAALRAQFDANFFGWHELTQLAVPVMRQQGSGRIVACSSILGLIAYRWRGAYNSSKFAVEGLFDTLRLELKGSGIHVALIEPGPISSKFGENAVPHFLANIDIAHSVHRQTYEMHLAKLQSAGGVNRFRRGPDAVMKKLEHALNAKHPKARYPVTIPAHFMAWMRSVLPERAMDRLLMGND